MKPREATVIAHDFLELLYVRPSQLLLWSELSGSSKADENTTEVEVASDSTRHTHPSSCRNPGMLTTVTVNSPHILIAMAFEKRQLEHEAEEKEKEEQSGEQRNV